MPLQGSWVEHWLDRYCVPGQHKFVDRGNRTRRCLSCHKEELMSGETCLVCGIPGEVTCRFSGEMSNQVRGRVCGPCLEEFIERRSIRGWTLVEVEQAG